jgi:lysophospholipase L1-like esterase
MEYLVKLGQNSLILLQGDSITDAGRNRQDQDRANNGLGTGYAFFMATQLLLAQPARGLRFYNRGISGNRITDLYARIREDILNLKPDVLSILIGVNDTWHGFQYNGGVALPKFERLYRQLLTEIRAELPRLQLVLCEPFVLKCGVVKPAWVKEMAQRRAIVKKLAGEFETIFVPFQAEFDRAAKLAPPEYWAYDGVHPTPAGHLLMTRAWLKAVVD